MLYYYIRGKLMDKQAVIDKWRKDKRRKISDSNKQVFCRGCRKDYYNGIGARCWHLAKAKLKDREIHMSLHEVKATEITTLNCYIPDYHRR